MARLYKLHNQVMHYDWGSPVLIPRLMGLPEDNAPWAELWMGCHPASPSLADTASGTISLPELIAGDPCTYLGEKTAQRFGSLPFLFKLLAAEKPLSIQVHPNADQAREAYERENKAGLAPGAPNRNYKDPNHKPEILCALSPFTALCGFREPEEINELLFSAASRLCVKLKKNNLRGFLEGLFNLSQSEREALTEFGLSLDDRPNEELHLVQTLARLYPGDPAILAPLYLNIVHLEPAEAIFLDAGVPHAYIHGFGAELMANSDNVLRGGLTSKHIDIPELMKVLNFTPSKPQIIRPQEQCYTYPTPCDEFSLSVLHGTAGASTYTIHAPAICIVTEGEISAAGTLLKQGESAFISAENNSEITLTAHKDFTLHIASVPA